VSTYGLRATAEVPPAKGKNSNTTCMMCTNTLFILLHPEQAAQEICTQSKTARTNKHNSLLLRLWPHSDPGDPLQTADSRQQHASAAENEWHLADSRSKVQDETSQRSIPRLRPRGLHPRSCDVCPKECLLWPLYIMIHFPRPPAFSYLNNRAGVRLD